jgi:hypothetical protein
MNTRNNWVGAVPIESSKAIVSHLKELDEDGNEFYVGLGPAGDLVERAMMKAGAKLRAEGDKIRNSFEQKQKRGEDRAKTLEELRAKRRAGKELTAGDVKKALDALLGI